MKNIFAFVLLFILSVSVSAIEIDSLKVKTEKKFLILPFGFYTNETSVALGIFSQYKFNQTDKIFGNVIYTFRNQFMLFCITEKKFDSIVFFNKFKLENYYTNSYGIGNDTKKDNKFDYRFFQFDNYIEAGKNIYKNTDLCFASDNFFHRPYNNEDILAVNYSPEKNQFANGIGGSVKYSTVTDKFFRDGVLIKSSFLFYPDFLGDLNDFSIFKSEAGFYKSIRESALNSHFITRFSFGSPHPEKLSYLGGSEILRGYPERRFIDKNAAAVQTQYDLRLFKNLSVCFFMSAGDVFDEFYDLSIENIKLGYGGGLIYEFKGLPMRIEAASSLEKGIEIIITGNRAF